MSKEEYEIQDLEKRGGSRFEASDDDSQPIVESTEVTKLSFFDRLALKLRAETKGIDPVGDDERNADESIWTAASMWFSANMVIAAFAVGALGPLIFGINFWGSVLATLVFSFLGVMPVAFYSVFGVELGLRQMVLSRFLLGNITARVFALINVVACVGWGAVNTIASAQLLHMVNPNGKQCPPWAGCLIIVLSTIFVTLFGYRVIHAYEKWSWIPNFAVFFVIIARLKIDGSFTAGPWVDGQTTAGGILSLGGVVFGFAAGWTTYAADYTVYMPRDTNRAKIFFGVMAGLMFPLTFAIILGAAAGAAAVNNALFYKNYFDHGIGGLVYAILVPNSLNGFGQFCCVLLAMSTVANNIPNMYSIALGTQAMWEPLAKVPRVFWTVAGNLVTLAIAIPAYYNFIHFMTNFMDAIAYYLAIYIAISLSEHLFYRKNNFKNYHVKDWDNWHALPIGYAGCSALVVGGFGVALGMSQTYWEGEIGRKIGAAGGDIGFELGFLFALVAYNVLRPLELKYVGR
ncbi:LANO_0B07118g1_1 [Lachancea nothofagi CBS 11611]|uniref:LANO_0B07118g1_1 n=1 Tax=Lachancea nothofagi CBS 11611 TaxID=1266666 RepID=A0A1G4J051_9SACH|nr:LANO_0B07118g1_1 [Lachancea nothofagi CBS 11611]